MRVHGIEGREALDEGSRALEAGLESLSPPAESDEREDEGGEEEHEETPAEGGDSHLVSTRPNELRSGRVEREVVLREGGRVVLEADDP